MDLYIDRDDLGRALARIQTIIERRSTNPLLAHVLLDAHAAGLRMTATDTEVAYIGDVAANVEKQGQLAVDAASLFQIVRALPESTVQLTINAARRLEVRSGRASFKLPGHAAEDFPPLPPFDARGAVQLREGELRRLVEQCSFAVTADDMRTGLNGAHLEERSGPNGKRLRMLGTDGHRLSCAECDVTGELAIPPRMLVPRKALAVLRKLLEGDKDEITLAFGEGAIHVTRPGQTFWFRMLDGQFPPDYESVVPTAPTYRAVVARDALSAALRRVSILVQDRARAVRFSFSPGELEIQTSHVDRGEVREIVPVELTGDAIKVGFNIRYLQDALGAMSGETVSLELAHPLAPCLVRDPATESAFFIVMPMKLD